MVISNDDRSSVAMLRECCALIYDEMMRLGLKPAREDWVRSDTAIDELVSKIREVWIEKYGGDPLGWPWHRGFVLKTFIQYRKKTRISKDDSPMLFDLLPQNIGYVYFLRNSRSHIKIGWTSNDPVKRMKDLQTGESEYLKLSAVMKGSEMSERALHVAFALHRIRANGEWFYSDPPHGDVLGGART